MIFDTICFGPTALIAYCLEMKEVKSHFVWPLSFSCCKRSSTICALSLLSSTIFHLWSNITPHQDNPKINLCLHRNFLPFLLTPSFIGSFFIQSVNNHLLTLNSSLSFLLGPYTPFFVAWAYLFILLTITTLYFNNISLSSWNIKGLSRWNFRCIKVILDHIKWICNFTVWYHSPEVMTFGNQLQILSWEYSSFVIFIRTKYNALMTHPHMGSLSWLRSWSINLQNGFFIGRSRSLMSRSLDDAFCGSLQH